MFIHSSTVCKSTFRIFNGGHEDNHIILLEKIKTDTMFIVEFQVYKQDDFGFWPKYAQNGVTLESVFTFKKQTYI